MEKLLEYYRTLHTMPELSGQEETTARYLTQHLQEMGYTPVRIAGTGLYADICADPALPWLVLRADMDALPVTEQTGVSYASENPGVMHACGHDAHMAMLLAAASELKGQKLPQNVRFLFQPAEEIIRGAGEMLEAGAVPENTVAVFGMHVWPGVPKGKVVAKDGPLMASSTTIQIQCHGRSAHCGSRERGADALQTAAQIATRFPEAEALAGGDGSVLFCGRLYAGTAHNIVAAEAELKGTLRTFSPESRQQILSKLESIAQQAAADYGTIAEVTYSAYSPAVNNAPALAKQVQKLLPQAIVDWKMALQAEDFARYQQVCPGMLLWLGVGDTPPLHNSKFLVPEEVLPVGRDTWMKLAQHKW